MAINDKTAEEIYKQKEIGEFMTTWEDFPRPGPRRLGGPAQGWPHRHGEEQPVHAEVPPVRHACRTNQSIIFLENDNHRIGAESVCGVQDAFHRYVDADIIYFQFCGTTTVETELGIHDMKPGEVMLVPGGISHRVHRYRG